MGLSRDVQRALQSCAVLPLEGVKLYYLFLGKEVENSHIKRYTNLWKVYYKFQIEIS